jgi:MFS family permease
VAAPRGALVFRRRVCSRRSTRWSVRTLQTGPYRRFVAAATISVYGDQLTTVALLVLLYRVTGSIEAPAAYLLAKQVPRIVGSVPAGGLADHFSPQLVVAVCSLLQAVTVAGIVAAGDRGSALAIYALVIVGQLGAGMVRAAMGAVMPRVVPPDRLARANAFYQLCQNTAYVGGPIIAAPLLAWKGPDPLLFIDVASFLVAAAIMATLPTLVEAGTQAPARPAGAFSGLRSVVADPLLSVLAASYVGEGIVVNVAASAFVLLADGRLGGDGSVALLYAFVGIGDAAGAIFVLRARPRRITPLVVLVPGLFSVGSIAFLGLAQSLWSAALPLVICGGGAVVFQTWGMAEAQRVTSREVMGRVSAVLYVSQAIGLMFGAGAQIVLLSIIRWDVALPLLASATVLALCVVGALVGRTRQATAMTPPVVTA